MIMKLLLVFMCFLSLSLSAEERIKYLSILELYGRGEVMSDGLVDIDGYFTSFNDSTISSPKVFYKYMADRKSLYVEALIGHYALDLTIGGRADEKICEYGGASGGGDIRILEIKSKKLYVKSEWSCGTAGCSYNLKFTEIYNSNDCGWM